MSDREQSASPLAGGALAAAIVAAFLLALIAFGGRSMAWVIAACALTASVVAIALASRWGLGRRIPRASLVAAAALVLLSLVSLVPLPSALVGALSGRRVEVAAAVPQGHGGLDRWLAAGKGRAIGVGEILAGDATAPAAAGESSAPGAASGAAAPETAPAPSLPALPLSFDREATLVALATLACFLSLLLALAGASETLGLRVLAAAGVATALMAIYAIAWAHVGNGKIYGIFAAPPNVGQQPFGPFWNPNHFAALLAAFGVLSLAAVLSAELPKGVRVGAGLAAIPFWLGVADAGSRGGVLGATAGLVVLGLLLLVGERRRRLLGVGLLGLATLGLILATLIAPEKILEQSMETATEMSGSNFERTRIYRAELAMLRSAPVTGVGLGAFRTAYPAFQTEPDPLVPLHGESDWLESLAEGGLPLALAWLVLAVSLLWPAIAASRRPDAPILLSGLIGGASALLAHAAVDFHLREPSVALIGIVMAGCAAAWGARLRGEPALDRASRVLPVSLALLGALLLAVLAGRLLPWDRSMRAAELAYAKGEVGAALDAASRATRAWPARASSWALLAACEEQSARDAKPRERAAGRERALAAAVEALRRNPLALGAARTAGQVLLASGSDAEALEAAELAVVVAPGHASAHRLLGQALLRVGRDDEALPHVAFAFDAVPEEQSSHQGTALARMLREAGHRDAARIFAHMRDPQARIRYLHRLVNDGHADETGPYFAIVMAEGVPAKLADAWAYGLVGGSREAAELGRILLPSVTQPISRVRIARALLAREEERAAGVALLERVIAEPDAPAQAPAELAMELRARGDVEAARAVVAAGLAAHPGDATLLALSR